MEKENSAFESAFSKPLDNGAEINPAEYQKRLFAIIIPSTESQHS